MKKIISISGFSALLLCLAFLSCGGYGRSYYGPMGTGRGHMYGIGFPFMGIFWIVLLLLIGFGIYYLIKNKDTNKDANESPLDILKKRYAKGELTKEEYEKMKEDIK